MNIEEKRQYVQALRERFDKSSVVIIADYQEIDVATITKLRRDLRDAQVEFEVVKNTMLTRASEGTDVELIKDSFKGPSAIAISYDDPIAPAKVLTDFIEQHNKLEIKVGVMDGRVLNFSSIKALASLPSREQLLAQVLSAMQAVPRSLVTALSDVPRRLVNVLQAIQDQKENKTA